MTELIIFAAIAAFILYQLYNVLGRKVGFKGEEKAVPAKGAEEAAGPARTERILESIRLPNLDTLKSRDTNFNEVNFLEKARETYEQVVHAFHIGELASVKDRLSDKVYESFDGAVAARTVSPTDKLTIIDTPKADIDLIDFKEDIANIRVRFLTEMAFEDIEKGSRTHQRTAEFWTFQKSLKTPNAPWLLSRVEAARA